MIFVIWCDIFYSMSVQIYGTAVFIHKYYTTFHLGFTKSVVRRLLWLEGFYLFTSVISAESEF
jgi:hypothetical protein